MPEKMDLPGAYGIFQSFYQAYLDGRLVVKVQRVGEPGTREAEPTSIEEVGFQQGMEHLRDYFDQQWEIYCQDQPRMEGDILVVDIWEEVKQG